MHDRRTWSLALGGGVAAVVLGLLAAQAWSPGVARVIVAADLAVGWAYIGFGTAAWIGRPGSASGRLLVAVGVAWFLGTIWPPLEFLHRGLLVHLLMTYPTGHLVIRPATGRGWARVVVVAVAYALSVTRFGGSAVGGLLLASAFAWVAVDAFVGGPGSAGRPRSTAGLAALAIGVVVAVGTVGRLIGTPLPGALLVYDAVLTVVAVVLAVDLLSERWAGGVVARVVVDLGDAANAGSVRDRLARAVGDPSLVVGFSRDDDASIFVDESGRVVDLSSEAHGRVVTPMVVDGRAVGFVAHDPVVLDDPRLVSTISAAAELAISNSTMQADLRARVAELAASRQRLVLAGDTQRRQLEQRLQGTAHRLDRVSAMLHGIDQGRSQASIELTGLAEDARLARAELLDFARGVHPATLTNGGLATAIGDLARRSPIAVVVDVDTIPLDPSSEATLYFVCSEALANAGKHADANQVSIEMRTGDRVVQLSIVDDGTGGAVVGERGGLRGLADRVEALGGTIAVSDVRAGGTRIDVTLPRREADPTSEVEPAATLVASGVQT